MKIMKKYIYHIVLFQILVLGLAACTKEEFTETIFPVDTTDRTDELDKWLEKNYTRPYNVDFQYKWKDIESDIKKTLTPADSAKSAKLAIIVKYLWFDAYNEVIGTDFLKANSPRQIVLIGSPGYENNGTMVLGTAEGGYKVTLYMVNTLTEETLRNYDILEQYYFTTLHHEFTHILNQKKPYDPDFDKISVGNYVSGSWYLVSEEEALRKGFIRNYAMVEGREDFAETLSQYITNSDEKWAGKLKKAGASGAAIINRKLEMIRTYMADSWNLDIDELHKAVQHRGKELGKLDLEHLN